MTPTLLEQVEALLNNQLTSWQLAQKNYDALKDVRYKTIHCNGYSIIAQYNPHRILSSTAKIDTKSINERPCFLCNKNRPIEQAIVSWDSYEILMNPYPIFSKHLTIASIEHTPQNIEGKISAMLNLAAQLPTYTIFYNGPQCGASAPDHFHFQAGKKGEMPIDTLLQSNSFESKIVNNNLTIYTYPQYAWGLVTFASSEINVVKDAFEKLYEHLKIQNNGVNEPMLNILATFENGRYMLHVIPRTAHRPSHYFKQTDDIKISPASVDLGGLWILPRLEDFEKLNSTLVAEIATEVCLPSVTFANFITNFYN